MKELKLGDRILLLRRHLGLTQSQLNKKLTGSTRAGTVSDWEKGITKPEAETLALIGEKTGVSLDWLILGRGPMMPVGESADTARLRVLRELALRPDDEVRQHAAILAAAATLRSLPDPLGRAGSEDEVGGPSGEGENNDGETTPPAKKKHRK